ncbi:HutD [compost metagenome]
MPVVLTQASEPFAFQRPVRSSPDAYLVSGMIVDLNVMTRRGAWTHQVERRAFESQHHQDAEGSITMLMSLGNLRIDSGARAEELGRLDCAILDGVIVPVRQARTLVPLPDYFLTWASRPRMRVSSRKSYPSSIGATSPLCQRMTNARLYICGRCCVTSGNSFGSSSSSPLSKALTQSDPAVAPSAASSMVT